MSKSAIQQDLIQIIHNIYIHVSRESDVKFPYTRRQKVHVPEHHERSNGRAFAHLGQNDHIAPHTHSRLITIIIILSSNRRLFDAYFT